MILLVSLEHRGFLIAACLWMVTAASLVLAYLLRFDFAIPVEELKLLPQSFYVALVSKTAAFYLAGLHHGWWWYAGLTDAARVITISAVGSAVFTVANYLVTGPTFSRSVYLIDFLIFTLLIVGVRFAARLYRELVACELANRKGKRILVYGAGAAGVMLVQDLRRSRTFACEVVGFIDDDRVKRNTRIAGLPVLGSGRRLAAIAESFRKRGKPIEEIVIAMPSANGGPGMREALGNCRAAGLPCRTVPGLGEILNGPIRGHHIRDISVNDLLGREPVQLDQQRIRADIQNRSVLVTGAAGSIGSELARQIAAFGPRTLLIFDQAESDLFHADLDLRSRYPGMHIVPLIGDITDLLRIEEVIRTYKVEIIFHAAAYKHVPMMEAHLLEAVKNNVLGTVNLIDSAKSNGVVGFVMISSDKAVNPASLMGLTKRVAELIVSAVPRVEDESPTKCASVRFGNVLASNGSVVQLFQKQIAAGGPVTVTHPEAKRFFMTVREAAQLVLQASSMSKGCEIFTLDMGEPIRVVDLAENMIRLAGMTPGRDIEIRFIGLRPGEKLSEEVNGDSEVFMPTYHEKVRIFRGLRVRQAEIDAWLLQLGRLMTERQESAVLRHLKILVPEYRGPREEEARGPILVRGAAG